MGCVASLNGIADKYTWYVSAAASGANDATPKQLAKLASLAKARCTETFVHVANEAVQMHGGYGYIREFRV